MGSGDGFDRGGGCADVHGEIFDTVSRGQRLLNVVFLLFFHACLLVHCIILLLLAAVLFFKEGIVDGGGCADGCGE